MAGKIVCVGTAIVDCIFTRPDGSVAEEVSLCPGGEAFNQAATLGCLGVQPVLLAAVGDDHAGRLLISSAEGYGVDTTKLVVRNDAATAVSGLFVDERGQRRSLVARRSAGADFVPDISRVDGDIAAVTMSSLFRPPFFDPERCTLFAKSVKARGALLLADTKMPRGTDPKLDDYRNALQYIDIITPNEDEAAHYTGKTDPAECAAVFHSYGVKWAVIKLGERGSYISHIDGESFFVPAFPANMVDGIGAGDAFAAGLLLSLCEGAAMRDAARFASACGALCVAHKGAVGGISSRAQVEKYYAAAETDSSLRSE